LYAAVPQNIIRSLGIASKAPDAGVTPAVANDQVSAGSSSTVSVSVGSAVSSGTLTGSLSSALLSQILALDNKMRIASTTAVTITSAPGTHTRRFSSSSSVESFSVSVCDFEYTPDHTS